MADMFTLEMIKVDDDLSIKLHFTSDGISLTLDPERPEAIQGVEWKDGCFDTGPGNGAFSLTWKGDIIEMTVAKYGDGNGGALTARVKKTPELTASLKQAFDQWKALFKKKRVYTHVFIEK
jgi:hypothetical protein